MALKDQTPAVYAAEDAWMRKELKAFYRFGDWDEIWPFYYKLAATLRELGLADVSAPAVKKRKGALAAHYDVETKTVHIPPYAKGGTWALKTGVAIHEFAHHMSPDAGHGPEFRQAMVNCLIALGWDIELLLDCYLEVGLSATGEDDGMVNKVTKLLTHAEKASTEEEQKTYIEKAESLAAEHRISLAILRKKQADADSTERDRPTTGKSYSLTPLTNTTYRNLASDLAMHISHAHGARMTIRGKAEYLTFYGFKEDIELTELMVTRITPMMFEASDQYLKTPEHKMSGTASVSARISFCGAYASEIGARLSEAVKRTEREIEETLELTEGKHVGTAIALKEKEMEVRDYVDFEFKRIGVRGHYKGSSTSNWDSGAAASGRESAQRANIFGRKALS